MIADVEKRLEAAGIKPTAMRNLVLEYLLKQGSAISLAELERGLAPVDRVTVYRTLKTFEEHCLVHSINDGTGAAKYALCQEDSGEVRHHDLHVHFYCNSCKETFCLPKTLIPAVVLPQGFISEEVSLVMKGVCERCSA
ncbi:Fur family transcriptional regulator [Pedobacter sp. SYSU D00535]|uniref:Fur family transcriptional regulator n=1 Tax=Pedobacter sp. SYSU D00535 TaxID=2810308 RepID=UPI001A95A7F0|nr:Fur family transcriptional regulator [Pedobacter sp. SYSU D00535]